ncbi:MAG: hypothetical protein COB65_07045 [Thalassobium sp.]|nr:MAG: hypothetical protein COB65_07045 [Thalassobium sp.]
MRRQVRQFAAGHTDILAQARADIGAANTMPLGLSFGDVERAAEHPKQVCTAQIRGRGAITLIVSGECHCARLGAQV